MIMKKKLYRDAIILILVFGLVWIVLSQLVPRRAQSDGWISKDQEEKVAEYLVEIIEKQFKVMDENPWQAGLDSMLIVLQSNIPDSKQPIYKVKVLDSSLVNAFATLGGHIYFFRGLLETAETPEEIAGILAHEMGHVEHEHVIKRLISEFGITIILGLSTGGDVLMLKQIIKTLTSGAFSRKQEKEADLFALNTMHDAGIDPRHLGIIFKRLQESQPVDMSQFEIINSHPSIKSRIKMSFEFDKSNFNEIQYGFPWPIEENEEEEEINMDTEL